MLKLHFITSGNMAIQLSKLRLDLHRKDPRKNVKSYITSSTGIYLEANDMGYFTDWGIIDLKLEDDIKDNSISVTIDSDKWGWYGTAQVAVTRNGEIIFSDNFQSGVKGPVGNPKRTKVYQVVQG